MSEEDTMKTRSMLLLAAAVALIASSAPAAVGVGMSFGVFYDGLSGHGEWINVDGGMYAWRPMHASADWRPYYEGRWLWTDDGWYWDSDEPWGWATYHYGRWYYDDFYGWIWIPGYEWAPAWVEWRYGGDYVGWAPLGPYAIFNAHFGVYYARHWVTPYHYWSFVDCRYITSPRVHQYVYRRENNTRFIGRTRPGGSVRYDGERIVSRGPAVDHVERRGNIHVDRTPMIDVVGRDEARIRRTNGQDLIGVYRPKIEERRGALEAERPSVVKNQERMPSLDTRAMDAHQRDRALDEGRNVERMSTPRSSDAGTRVGRLDREGTARDSRVYERPRNNANDQATPPAPERRIRRDNGQTWTPPERNVERRSTPNIDRPSRQSVPGVRRAPEVRSAPRSEGGSGRANSGSRGSGGSRDRR
jgi:hypothetical protein